MSIRIRQIEQKDNPKIAATIRSILTEHGMNKPGTVYTDPTTNALFELFQTKGSFYWVVESDETILGGCGIYPTTGLKNGCVELVKLYLSKELRGKGIGRQLMKLCDVKAKTLGYETIYLESMPELNRAVHLYRKMGYETLKTPMGNSGHFACNLWIQKKLS